MASTCCPSFLKARRDVFVGVARNYEPYLSAVLGNLGRLGGLYSEASFMFVVSDSKNATSSILHKWLDEGRRGRVPGLGSLEQQLPLRTERLALVRNPYMDQVRVGKEAAYDHLIVVDLDDVLATPVSTVVFARAARWLDAAPTRGGVFANGTPYYDIWALRHDAWCSHSCWHPVRFREAGQDKRLLEVREVFARMIPLWVPPIRVLSAFGGIGIYKLTLVVAARYVGLDDKGRETCEHVAFNAGVRKAGGQLYIYPALVTRSPTVLLTSFAVFERGFAR